jgi:hypothetical protein
MQMWKCENMKMGKYENPQCNILKSFPDSPIYTFTHLHISTLSN